MGGVNPGELGMDPDTPTDRDKVREQFVAFVKGFTKELPHKEKIERYIDVLMTVPIADLDAAFDELKGERSLPAPDKIKAAAMKARMLREVKKTATEKKAALEELADPKVREQMRNDFKANTAGLLDEKPEKGVLERLVEDAGKAGLVGEDRALKLVFLALHTRHFDSPGRPVSVAVKGTSSSGKSFTVTTAAKFLAPGSVIEMSGMSPKWMVYASEQGLDFSHRFLFVHEATGIDEEVEGMLRVLLSEGCIVWRTVIDQEAHTLTVSGPTGLIETTTRISLHEENETRILSIPSDESREQTAQVLERMGKGPEPVDFEPWYALDRWVAIGPRRVEIPFQETIGKLAVAAAPRVRRDLTTLLELVRAHALLHEPDREVRDGVVVATLEGDYTVVHGLTADLFAEASELTVAPNVRATVTAAQAIVEAKLADWKDRQAEMFSASEKTDKAKSSEPPAPTATVSEIAKHMGKNRRSVARWVEAAVEAEFLEAAIRTPARGVKQKVKPGTRAMPAENTTVFPTVEAIKTHQKKGNGAGPDPLDDEPEEAHGEPEPVPF